MSFGFMGIQFGFALQNANTSRIFETLGAAIDDISILWIAAPVTGLVVQPIIGYFSDKTWNRLGRRRPYFLVGAIVASLALCLMPNSPTLWMAAGMLWIMDAAINVSMEPFRAFVGDNLPNEQRTLGFAMQSFFIGIGAVVGSLLPWIFSNWLNLANTAPEGVIPPSVKWSFYIGAGVFLLSVLWTVFRSFEYSPEELASFEKEGEDYSEQVDPVELKKRQQRWGWIFSVIGAILTIILVFSQLEKELYILGIGLVIVGILFLFSASTKGEASEGAFHSIMQDMIMMPPQMRQLAVVQFFSWFALFAMWIYTTAAVTSHIYGSTDTQSSLYNEGADYVSVLFAVYNGVAALVAFLLPVMARRLSRRVTHMICLVLGGLGLMSVFVIQEPNLLMLSMVGVGIAWASILSMPYAMLSSALPSDKMGYYMGVFNFFIVIPQIVAATILGILVKNIFAGAPIYALIIGGVSMVLAGLLSLRVEDRDQVQN